SNITSGYTNTKSQQIIQPVINPKTIPSIEKQCFNQLHNKWKERFILKLMGRFLELY
ncbi:12303_t:CDS:1, partial [Gigaspora margarita]